ncbi:hypothetical protein KXD40_005714 [Peronospora effusa]|nr:hypothetical protein KXD40_005714 [Peronospora effusa]
MLTHFRLMAKLQTLPMNPGLLTALDGSNQRGGPHRRPHAFASGGRHGPIVSGWNAWYTFTQGAQTRSLSHTVNDKFGKSQDNFRHEHDHKSQNISMSQAPVISTVAELKCWNHTMERVKAN